MPNVLMSVMHNASGTHQPAPRADRYRLTAAIGLASVFLTACSEHTYPDLATGKELYEHHCESCHKAHGQGMFTKGVPASRLAEIHLAELKDQIKSGSGMMPAFERMTDEQIEKINQYLKSQMNQKGS